MEHIDSNKKENAKTNLSKNFKVSPALQTYIEARNELIKKYAAKLPEWKLA